MTRAIDPFEDYLRKKKVEMLEEQYRGADQPEQESDDELTQDNWTPPPTKDDSPEREVQVEQEMNEFFSEGGSAGADLFERANVIDEDRVDEIQDALDEVFEAEKSEPEDASGVDDTFVDFFKQVQTDFVPEPMISREPAVAREIVQPEVPGDFDDEPLTAEFPAPGEVATREVATGESIDEASDGGPEGGPEGGIESGEPDLPAFLEVSPRMEPEAEHQPEERAAVSTESRLELSEILGAPKEGEDLRQHVHLLSRLVVKLVERSNMPESEIIEVLIKSGVEF